jgi:hypothetical protein
VYEGAHRVNDERPASAATGRVARVVVEFKRAFGGFGMFAAIPLARPR